MGKIESVFLKSYREYSFLTRRKAEYLLRFSSVVLLICLIGIALYSSFSEFLFYAVSFISFVGVVWFLIRGNLNRAVWITVIAMSVDILCDVLQFHPLTYERIVETIMESFLSYILIGFIAVNIRQIIYTISTNTMVTALHAFLIIHFGYANSPLPSSADRYFIGGVIAVLSVGFLTLVIVRIHEEAIIIVERQKESLTTHNKQLEELVRIRTHELEVANCKLEEMNRELMILATHDELTDIPNRRKVLHEADQLLTKSIEQGTPINIAMLDIDHFKQINDTYGHLTGDLVLKTLVNITKSSLRTTDIVGRIGGEEFLIVLNNASKDVTLNILNDLKNTVENALFQSPNDHSFHVTVSIGFSWFTGDESLKELIHQADMSLYQSKYNGRNQVTMYKDLVKYSRANH